MWRLFSVFLLLFCLQCEAKTFTWRGETGYWNGEQLSIYSVIFSADLNNWDPIGLPTPEDDVFIPSPTPDGGPNIVILTEETTIFSATIGSPKCEQQGGVCSCIAILEVANATLHSLSVLEISEYGKISIQNSQN